MAATQTATAAPAKLRNGDWGAKVQSETIHAGDTITVTTRAGKSWDAQVTKVVWSGSGVSICATQRVAAQSRSTPSPKQSRQGGRCRECRGTIKNATHHRAMEGLCGHCAFDEFDC